MRLAALRVKSRESSLKNVHRFRRFTRIDRSPANAAGCTPPVSNRGMHLLLGIGLLLLPTVPALAQTLAKPAVPLEPITAILALFKEYRLVGLGEGPHNNIEGHRFRLSLVRDPRFPTFVNDIVVESGSGRYQDVMDRYVNGEAVPYAQLRRVWEDTTSQNTVFDKPIYAEFYTAVRDVNRTLSKEKRIRVLLGEPPIAW